MSDIHEEQIGDLVCTDLEHGATYPDGSLIPFSAGEIVHFHAGGVFVNTGRLIYGRPIHDYIDAWRAVDRARPYVLIGDTGPIQRPRIYGGGHYPTRYRSANMISVALRSVMEVEWSRTLAVELVELQPGRSMTVHTLVGRATIAREV